MQTGTARADRAAAARPDAARAAPDSRRPGWPAAGSLAKRQPDKLLAVERNAELLKYLGEGGRHLPRWLRLLSLLPRPLLVFVVDIVNRKGLALAVSTFRAGAMDIMPKQQGRQQRREDRHNHRLHDPHGVLADLRRPSEVGRMIGANWV